MTQLFTRFTLVLTLVCSTLVLCSPFVYSQQDDEQQAVDKLIDDAFEVLIYATNTNDIDNALTLIDHYWQPAYIANLLDLNSVPSSTYLQQRIFALLAKKTEQDFAYNTNDWYFWHWNQNNDLTSTYSDFKAELYQNIDPKFKGYFLGRQNNALIRLDEVRWGGVTQDGIPPLRNPQMISAKEADYLQDDNIVFGLAINNDARAYPKRILAWHEMFVDTVGGVEVAGVYCTLCGTVIPYKTRLNGVNYKLGTSGFLYRSNKLMYDRDTQSLWSTVLGKPVIGPLANKGIQLEHVNVVTTTWGEWKRRHPDTSVLSLNTGHRRNYNEGVAYQNYFATDQLMFNTPFQDDRLNNKQEVLALTFPAAPSDQLAIDTAFLNQHPLYQDTVGRQKLIVLTDKSGANRVYDPKNMQFISYDGDSTLTDNTGSKWILGEEKLTSEDGTRILERLPHRRAFWFGWHAAFPDTRLVK